MAKVEARRLETDPEDRRAWFTCALAVAWPSGPVVVVEGVVRGEVVFPPRGDRGFGYDPIFVADGETLTFGEMDPDRKDAISHRARAFEALKAALF
jgi:XTP/dITP diphosphohydrolase